MMICLRRRLIPATFLAAGILTACSDPPPQSTEQSSTDSQEVSAPDSAPPLDRDPEEAYQLALGHLANGRIVVAIGLLDQAIATDSSRSHFHLLLGQALRLDSPDRNLREAREALEQADELGATEAKGQLARLDADEGRWADIADSLAAILAAPTTPATLGMHVDACALEARRRLEAGSSEGVEELLVRAVQGAREFLANPQVHPWFKQQAQRVANECDEVAVLRLLHDGEVEAAITNAKLIVGARPGNSAARELFAKALAASGEESAAEAQQRAAELLAEFDLKVAQVAVPVERFVEIHEELQKLPPLDPRATLKLARACLRRLEFERAVTICQEARTAPPEAEPPSPRIVAEAWFLEGKVNDKAASRLLDHHSLVPSYLERAAECYEQAAVVQPVFRAESDALQRKMIDRLGRVRGGE